MHVIINFLQEAEMARNSRKKTEVDWTKSSKISESDSVCS